MSLSVDQFVQLLLAMDRRVIWQQFQSADLSPFALVETLIVPALEKVGAGWEKGELALSQVYMSGRICEELLNTFLPPGSSERVHQPKIAVVVLEDYHMLGKRLVYAALQASGYDVLDYGRMDAESLVRRSRSDEIDILMISALMLPAALRVKAVTTQVQDEIKVVVGGAPFRFDAQLWQEVGADVMGYNASDAIAIVKQITGGEL